MAEVGTAGAARTGGLGPAGVAVAAAGVAVNALAFVAPLLGARMLSAGDLSVLATILALGPIAVVPGLGLQAALAVRWAREGRVPSATRATIFTAASTGSSLLLLVPLISATLHLPPVLSVLMAVMTVAVVLGGRWLGELQGTQRFVPLSFGLVLLGAGRYLGVIIGLLMGLGVTGSFGLGVAVAWLTLPVLALLARRSATTSATRVAGTIDSMAAPGPSYVGASLGWDIAAAGGASLAMLAVSYADLILARHLLAPDAAGEYAVGAILTKGALWAPQVVTILALPRMAQGSRRALLLALGVVAACGTVLVTASLLAGGLATSLAGGPAYAGLGRYAVGFAAVGALYAIVFVFVNAEIAARVRFPALPLWVALLGFASAALLLDAPTLGGILRLSVITALVTAVAMAVVTLRPGRPLTPRSSQRDRGTVHRRGST